MSQRNPVIPRAWRGTRPANSPGMTIRGALVISVAMLSAAPVWAADGGECPATDASAITEMAHPLREQLAWQ